VRSNTPYRQPFATLAAVTLIGLPLLLAGCASSSSTSAGGTTGSAGKLIRVVAAENFWGSIAGQLGGSHVQVTNIINSPDADPHDYEATAADARAIAGADLVVINGVGYDDWAAKLAAANPVPNRVALTVGDLVAAPAGGNPHRWYNPDDVTAVVKALVADYTKLDPADAAYFSQQQATFETSTLSDYHAAITEITTKYAGTPVGASESIFAMIAPALGLDLITPPGFLTAISEGTDPTAADKTLIDDQIKGHKIKVYVYNSQNATPDVQTQIAEAKAAGIPITTITETLTPAGASWEQWQTAQLVALRDALAKATGK
jgi:zinc/manganese transport system substrate-binding protein